MKRDKGIAILGILFILAAMLFLTPTVQAYSTDPIVPSFLQTLIPVAWYSFIIFAGVALFVECARAL